MSVVHEAIKRSSAAKNAPGVSPALSKPALTVEGARSSPAWLWWLMLFFVLAEGGLYLRERSLRLDAQEKMLRLKTKYNDALRSKTEALNAEQSVEYDNLANQKKVSDLTKKMHEIEMSRLRLEDEVKKLRAEPGSK